MMQMNKQTISMFIANADSQLESKRPVYTDN